MWAVEHHSLKWYAHMSAPEIFLSYVAAKTSRIRIGHGVVCMPFQYNHPVRVAERAAMLDLLSEGRLDLGAGRGATLQEMSLCGVDPKETYPEVEEALRLIASAWRSDTFSWHGAKLTIEAPEGNEPHSILPRPVQLPHPPLFMACTKESTVGLAADYGIGALVLGFAGPDEVIHLNTRYRDAVAGRTGERFVSTAGQRLVLGALPDDRPRRPGRGAPGRAPGASGSSPSPSPTGTGAARGRPRTPRMTTTSRPSGPTPS